MKEGGFDLSKWQSNHPAISGKTPQKEVKIRDKVEEDEEEEKSTKVLGVAWKPEADILVADYDPEIARCIVNTPRDVVSYQAKIYDPHGNWVPYTVDGRYFLQICKAGERGWDSPLDPEVVVVVAPGYMNP